MKTLFQKAKIILLLLSGIISLTTVAQAQCPSCNISGDSIICSGAGVTLCAPSGIGYTYLWSNGATTSCITVTAASTYSLVVVSNGDTCSIHCSKTVTSGTGITQTTAVAICDSYTWNGTTYTTSSVYTYNYLNSAGCVSTDILALTVLKSTTSTTTATVCNSYTWNGTTYTTGGTYSFNASPNAAGCDSIAYLNLTINSIYTANITERQANTVAVNFFKLNSIGDSLPMVLYYTDVAADCSVNFYVFNVISQPGFVIVTGNEIFEPVVAYSTESNFDITPAANIGVSDWMSSIRNQIDSALMLNVQADSGITALWNAYLSGTPIPHLKRHGGGQPPISSVAPLLNTTWNQAQTTFNPASSTPQYYPYNLLCPYNSRDQEHCWTGCTATAMAQIMKYWNYPPNGTGSNSYIATNLKDGYSYGKQTVNFGATTYNWSLMPDSLTAGTYSNYDYFVDQLMYDCGVSVNTDYGDAIEGGSGAAVCGSPFPSAQTAYVNYFGYAGTIQCASPGNSSSAWVTLLENELNNNRPIQYAGAGQEGHTWVIDGYDGLNLFHQNWGWGGFDDGYYSLSNLNPSVDTYTTGFAALIGIEPNSNCLPALPVSITVGGGINAVCPGDQRTYSVPLVAGVSYYSWTVPTGATWTWTTHNAAHNSISVSYNSGFTAAGSVSVTAINSCGLSPTRQLLVPLNIPVATTIIGPATACPGYEITYSTPVPVPAGITFNWTTTSGATIIPSYVSRIPVGAGAIRVKFNSLPCTISVTTSDGCGTSSATSLTVQNACSGRMEQAGTGKPGDVDENENIIAYPNPAHDKLNVDFSSANNGDYIIKMFDMTGRLLLNRSANAVQGDNHVELDLNTVAKGVYDISFTSGDVSKQLRIVIE